MGKTSSKKQEDLSDTIIGPIGGGGLKSKYIE